MIEIRLKASGSPVRGRVTCFEAVDGYQRNIIKVGASGCFMKLYHRCDSPGRRAAGLRKRGAGRLATVTVIYSPGCGTAFTIGSIERMAAAHPVPGRTRNRINGKSYLFRERAGIAASHVAPLHRNPLDLAGRARRLSVDGARQLYPARSELDPRCAG